MRIAVLSPYLDRRGGTERAVIELIERLCQRHGCEVHIYSQRVEDIEVAPFRSPSAGGHNRPFWHRIPKIPGPHLFNFLWWVLCNRLWRTKDRWIRGIDFDLVFCPGINSSRVDAIVTHIVFREFFRLVHDELRLSAAPLRKWPLLIHRLLYYRFIMYLEGKIYRDPRVALAAVSKLTATELTRHFGREDVTVIPNGVDSDLFTMAERLRRREVIRKSLQIDPNDFVVLFIGNDWKKKGLSGLLEAVALLRDLPIRLVIAGRDNRIGYDAQIGQLGLGERVLFLDPSGDVMQFYAAADVYAGPTLHDSFALPPIEAMACGLPVITTSRNGGAQIVEDAVNGYVLPDPRDNGALAGLLRMLYEQPDMRARVGESAARTAQQYTWERNAEEGWKFIQEAAARKAESGYARS